MTSQETEMMFDELDQLEVREDGLIEVKYRQKPRLTFEDGKIRGIGEAPLSKWT